MPLVLLLNPRIGIGAAIHPSIPSAGCQGPAFVFAFQFSFVCRLKYPKSATPKMQCKQVAAAKGNTEQNGRSRELKWEPEETSEDNNNNIFRFTSISEHKWRAAVWLPFGRTVCVRILLVFYPCVDGGRFLDRRLSLRLTIWDPSPRLIACHVVSLLACISLLRRCTVGCEQRRHPRPLAYRRVAHSVSSSSF